MSPAARPSEDSLIARYFAPLAAQGGLGLKDDAACFTPTPGHDLVATADALVERGHFLPEDDPGSVARKALAVNVSDLAAKGATPRGFLLSLALPGDWTEAWLSAFAEGLGEAAREFRCPLLGGDTVKASGALTLSVTALGEVPSGRMVLRTAAKPGDVICVTGSIGDAALGLALRGAPDWASDLTEQERAVLADRYLRPQPRVAVAEALRDHARAAMDISDGLAGDLAKMMRVSGVSAIVETDRIPLSSAVRRAVGRDPALLDLALTGGDDYEILCAVSPERIDPFRAAAADLGVDLTEIGAVTAGEGLPVFRSGQRETRYETGSFSHF